MKLEKFSTMFTDFRFWKSNTVFDVVRVGKPSLAQERNLSFVATTADFEVITEGNILQIDGIIGNAEFYIRFNELNAPTFKVLGKSTFRIPFYRIFVSCTHYGGATASQIRIKTLPNCSYDALNTVDLAGKNVQIMKSFSSQVCADITVPAGGTADLDWTVLAGGTTYPLYVRYLKVYNPDPAITLNMRFASGSPNTFPLFATQLFSLDFSAPLLVNKIGTPLLFRFENPGANAVVVNVMTGFEVDNYFV